MPTDAELDAALELAIDKLVAEGKAERFTAKNGKPGIRLIKAATEKSNEKAGS